MTTSDATRSAAAGRRSRPLAWVGVVALLAVAATADFRSVMSNWSFLLPALVGSASAVGVVIVANRFRLVWSEVLAAALLLLGVVTVFVVGGVPTPRAFGDAIDAVVGSWADLLSAVPPAEMTPSLRFPPMFLAWLGALVGALLVLRAPRSHLAVAGPILTLVLTILLTEERNDVMRVLGVVMAVAVCASGFVGGRSRRRAAEPSAPVVTSASATATPESRPLAGIGRGVAPVAVLVAVGVLALLVGPHMPLASANDRYGLRDDVVPPWNPLSVPSPLGDLKASLADERVDDVVFSVTAGDPIDRFTLAVMRDFDGIVWTVADAQGGAADEFRPVGPDLPDLADREADAESVRRRVEATITVVDLAGPWIPSPGEPRRIEFEQGGLRPRENLATGTLALPGGLPAGTEYSVEADLVTTPSDQQLIDRNLPPVVDLVDLEALPPAVRNFSADLIEGIDRGWGQIAAIRDRFVANGFYDRSTRVGPGHSYYRMGTFLADPEQIVGFEEQYAAAAALVARIAELPSRVVVGYLVDPDRWSGGRVDVLASDIGAWIEVDVDGLGWMPVDVAPPRSREPNVDNSTIAQNDVATPNPPPPPQPPPNVDVVTDTRDLDVEELDEEEEQQDEDDEEVVAGSSWWSGLAGVGAGLVSLFLLACVLVIGWKALRTRRRRRTHDVPLRIAGAWDDLEDRFREARRHPEIATTPLETARAVVAADPSGAEVGPDLVALVRLVDRAAYHAESPDPSVGDDAWRHYDDVLEGFRRERSVVERARMRLDPRPLRHRIRRTAPPGPAGASVSHAKMRTMRDDDGA